MKLTGLNPQDLMLHDGMNFENAPEGVLRDKEGVPLRWTLLKVGDNPLVKNGEEGNLILTDEDILSILKYFQTKGELLPIDSNHFLHELASQKGMDETDVLKLIPGKTAAMGYGSLSFDGKGLLFHAEWTPIGYKLMKEKIFKYFSPALRGLKKGPLRVTSVAMENEPAINNLDALAASAHCPISNQQKETRMDSLEKALEKLLGRDSVALDAGPENTEKIAAEINAKSDLLKDFRETLKLAPDVSDPMILVALKNLSEKAGGADALLKRIEELQSKVDSMELAENKRTKEELIRKGREEGKITCASEDFWRRLDTAALSAELAKAPVVVPQGAFPRTGLVLEEIALTAEDREVCRAFGFTENDFLEQKKKFI